MIQLPAGYSSRAATLDDLDPIVEVFNAWERAHLDELVMSRTTLVDDWSRPWFDPAGDTVVVETGGVIVGFASCASHDVSYPFDAWGGVHPDSEGRGVGTALARWAEERARRDLGVGSSADLWNGTHARNAAGLLLFENLGYAPIRTFVHMAMAVPADVPEEAAPDGIEIHPCGGAEERGLWETMQEAFAEHFGFYPQPMDEWWAEQRSFPTFDPALTLVAVAGGDVVGGSIGYVDEGIGWVGEIGVRTGWQRRGVGRALLLRALSAFGDRTVSHMRLNVDVENTTNASALYRSIGMDVVQEWRIFEKSITRG